ncbi:GNAT family N-acetyltransferase [Georgenia alba]|uniref:GNAT family N-acetyltransferase n=1 Tax=Georgenia alba TaxID=2233858 RepID=A0ABW2Q7W7_9MICO
MDTTIRHERSRFEILVDGEVAGFTEYLQNGDRRIFVHTVVDPAFEGHGLAGTVVRHALETTRREGMRVVAVCPYVAGYVERHPEVADLVDPVTREDAAVVRAHEDDGGAAP